MKTLKPLLSVLLLIVVMTVVTAAPASAHSGGSNQTYYYTGAGNCQLDHFVTFNWAGSNNSDSYAYNTNCWSTYSRVYFNGTSYVEASGNPVNSLASWPNHQYVGSHLACFGLYNCSAAWFGDYF